MTWSLGIAFQGVAFLHESGPPQKPFHCIYFGCFRQIKTTPERVSFYFQASAGIKPPEDWLSEFI
jgi:hypothetical protein